MRQHVDADAERLQFGDALEHPGGNADLVQAERQGQPADATARNQDRHDTPSRFGDVMTWERGRGQPRRPLAAAGDGRAGVTPLSSRPLWEDTKCTNSIMPPVPARSPRISRWRKPAPTTRPCGSTSRPT